VEVRVLSTAPFHCPAKAGQWNAKPARATAN
jgi:hypothetical protein